MGYLRVSMPSEGWDCENEVRKILEKEFGSRLGASIKDSNNGNITTFQYIYTCHGFAECIYNEREVSIKRIQELLMPMNCACSE